MFNALTKQLGRSAIIVVMCNCPQS